jgi:branched-chain amino acid transport system ATP-binding protein
VMVGAHSWSRAGGGFLAAIARTRRQRQQERLIREHAMSALVAVGLDDPDRLASELPLGLQRCVQLARALCGKPSLLLLDEPAAGLRAAERDRLALLLGQLRAHENAMTVLLVEHDVGFVRQLADKITVLAAGQILAEGPPHVALADPAVQQVYLGTEAN